MVVRKLIHVDEGGPLVTTRALLQSFWESADLEALLIPTWEQTPVRLGVELITDPDRIVYADPYAPTMTENAACKAYDLVQKGTYQRLALFLRPCELRSYDTIAAAKGGPANEPLLLSSDCLAVFPAIDFNWRVDEAEHPEDLTLEVLHFSAQGGILPSRYQRGCQICENPFPEDVDLHFNLLGLMTGKQLVLEFRDQETATRFGIDELGGEDVPSEILTRRARVVEKIVSWRSRSLAYTQSHLDQAQASLQGFADHLLACPDCCDRLMETCPLFEVSLIQNGPEQIHAKLEDWIASCAGCGLCDYNCPRDYPLFTVIAHLNRSLTGRMN
jgi:formate dehydrogenase subunit beta